MERLLDTEDVLQAVGFGKTWLHDRIAEGSFPKPMHKWRRNKWRAQDVENWIIQHYAVGPADQPTPGADHAAH